jgi:hypothetical protein
MAVLGGVAGSPSTTQQGHRGIGPVLVLVLLVSDSEYSRSAGAKPIFLLSCIYLVSPGALLLLLR